MHILRSLQDQCNANYTKYASHLTGGDRGDDWCEVVYRRGDVGQFRDVFRAERDLVLSIQSMLTELLDPYVKQLRALHLRGRIRTA